MELRQIEAFVRVAQLGGFTRAADALSLTQPAITRQIASLEAELQARLLDRMGRMVALTTEGEAFLPFAVEMLRLRKEGIRAVGDVTQGIAGRLTVGASSTAATYALPTLLRRFRETYPKVELSVHTGVSSRIVERVLANELELGVVMDFRGQEDLIEVPLAEYAMALVLYPDHPLAQRRSVATSELGGQALIVMETGTNLRGFVERVLGEVEPPCAISLELDNVEAIKKMIEAQLGVSLLPRIAVREEAAAGRLVALDLEDAPHAFRPISAVYRRDKHLTASLKAFLAMLREALSALPA